MRKLNTITGMEKLDSDLLRTFLAIADAGSFTEGAVRIFRSQSAASLQIKKLETLLAQDVFERKGRGVVLSSVGEKLYPVAQQVTLLLDAVQADLKSNQLEGTIRIGIPDEYGDTILPQVISQFSRDHPKVELEVQCAVSSNFQNALECGKLDIAVFDEETPKPGMQVLSKQRMVWGASRNHSVHMDDSVPLALFACDCWWRDVALDALYQAGKKFKVIYTSESVAGVIAAAEAGVAICLLGERSLKSNLRELTQAEGFPKLPNSSLVLACRDGFDSELLSAMTNAIKDSFKEHFHSRGQNQ
ncbi:MAG: LysR family transcriptional regulator [Rhodospirillales bacterium]|nr:LysR family transcriptional regulator [Rhodospirillales bacterium]